MKFEEFISNVEKVMNKYGIISFSEPTCDNGASFGVIKKSNLDGILITGREEYIGDGDKAMTDIELTTNLEESFVYIWSLNGFQDTIGSYKDYNFQFKMVPDLVIDSCYYVL